VARLFTLRIRNSYSQFLFPIHSQFIFIQRFGPPIGGPNRYPLQSVISPNASVFPKESLHSVITDP